jgi:bacteriocin-like protein
MKTKHPNIGPDQVTRPQVAKELDEKELAIVSGGGKVKAEDKKQNRAADTFNQYLQSAR